MKRFGMIGLVCAVCWCLSFAAEPTESPQTQLANSLKTWEKLKAECGGNYSYKVSFASWVGSGRETEIVVKQNKVVERKYREWSRQMPKLPGEANAQEEKNWTEQGDKLGSHNQGAPVKTLDELYKEAAAILEKKMEEFQRLVIRFDNRGLLQACFTMDTRIADDAPKNGVNISSIELLPVAK